MASTTRCRRSCGSTGAAGGLASQFGVASASDAEPVRCVDESKFDILASLPSKFEAARAYCTDEFRCSRNSKPRFLIKSTARLEIQLLYCCRKYCAKIQHSRIVPFFRSPPRGA